MTHEHAVETLAIERYLLREMAEQERDAFEEHFFSCAECSGDARAAGAMRDGVAAGMISRVATTPGRVLEMPAPRRRVGSAIVPWAAAASLALVAGYQAFVLLPSLKRSAGPMVLSPVTLRPASRGEEPVVFASAGALITLAVDLGGATFDGDIEYEIRHAGGAPIALDRAPAPKDGSPLLLLLPAALLQPGEHYVLLLKNSGSARLTTDGYRFTVGAR
jgi:hypothetical protein